jgi:hypothetical protein
VASSYGVGVTANVRFGSTSDIFGAWRHVCFVPQGDICSAANRGLFDHLVGQREQRRRNFKPERFGGLQIDDELELGRLHYR